MLSATLIDLRGAMVLADVDVDAPIFRAAQEALVIVGDIAAVLILLVSWSSPSRSQEDPDGNSWTLQRIGDGSRRGKSLQPRAPEGSGVSQLCYLSPYFASQVSFLCVSQTIPSTTPTMAGMTVQKKMR